MLDLALTNAEWFLVECIRHRDYLHAERLRQLYAELGDEGAYTLAVRNRIVSVAADAMLRAGIALSERWKIAYADMDSRISEYMSELDKTADLLTKQGITLVALKNSGIARALYPYPAASPMGDIDVLVQRQDFRRAHEILSQNGYAMKFRSPLEEDNLESAEQGGGAEYSVQLASGRHLWFELQWRPVAGRWIRPDQEPDAAELVKRSIPIAGSQAKLLAPEDNLLQVALHTAKHTYVRSPGFRLHTDIDRIVRSSEIDWDKFLGLVIQLQVKTAVFFSLAFANKLLVTPIPESVLIRLAPPRWKLKLLTKWLQRVGLFDPEGAKWGRFGYIVFVALLYDDWNGFMLGVFPKPETIMGRHNIQSRRELCVVYMKRLANMLLKRTLVKSSRAPHSNSPSEKL